MTIFLPTLPMNGCDDCAWLTEGFEERTYCEECARDIAELKDAAELAFCVMRDPAIDKNSVEYIKAENNWTAACAEIKFMEG